MTEALADMPLIPLPETTDCTVIQCKDGTFHAACNAEGQPIKREMDACADAPNIFKDVPANHDAAAAIASVKAEGAFEGYPDGTFRPNGSITRAELVTVLFRNFFSEKPCEWGSRRFTDVPDNDWFSQSVCHAQNFGYVKGYGDGTFRPHQIVTLPEAAKIILRQQGIVQRRRRV